MSGPVFGVLQCQELEDFALTDHMVHLLHCDYAFFFYYLQRTYLLHFVVVSFADSAKVAGTYHFKYFEVGSLRLWSQDVCAVQFCGVLFLG